MEWVFLVRVFFCPVACGVLSSRTFFALGVSWSQVHCSVLSPLRHSLHITLSILNVRRARCRKRRQPCRGFLTCPRGRTWSTRSKRPRRRCRSNKKHSALVLRPKRWRKSIHRSAKTSSQRFTRLTKQRRHQPLEQHTGEPTAEGQKTCTHERAALNARQRDISRSAADCDIVEQLREAKKHEVIVEGQRLRRANIMEGNAFFSRK